MRLFIITSMILIVCFCHLNQIKIDEDIVKNDALWIVPTMSQLQENKRKMIMKLTIEESKEYIGMWVTKDGYIRHELLPNNRYDEARGSKMSAYQGKYNVRANHINYKDDTGFNADGEFKDGILYHAGMILYKEKN
ncbi:Atu4866 domain-containing protein [Pedobacter mendelii]